MNPVTTNPSIERAASADAVRLGGPFVLAHADQDAAGPRLAQPAGREDDEHEHERGEQIEAGVAAEADEVVVLDREHWWAGNTFAVGPEPCGEELLVSGSSPR